VRECAVGEPSNSRRPPHSRWKTEHGGPAKRQLDPACQRRGESPFTIKVTELLVPDTELLESFCAENEKDVAHISN